MGSDVRQQALGRLVQLGTPVLQRMELAAPWCVRIDGCNHPGMYVVHRGAARMDVLGSKLLLEAGDAVLLPRGGGIHVVGDTIGTAPLSLAAREDPREPATRQGRRTARQTSISCVPFLSAPLAWLPRMLVVRGSARDSVASSLLTAYERALENGEADVLARITEALWIRSFTAYVPSIDHFDVDVLRAAAEVLEAPAAEHTLQSLARSASLSRSRFSARFNASFGEPPMRWVQRVRMEHAARLLREGTMSVAAIAEILGFGDESAFRKAYRRHRGRPARIGDR